MIIHGDSLDVLKTLEANSIDSCVCDPPYGLAFMGKRWDHDVPSVDLWREVLRVLKPGGHLLSFGGTRTYHRMVVNIEDAGFEIRDQIIWLYGSGFPKSLSIDKAIDKAAGANREKIGEAKRSGSSSRAFQSEEKTTAGQHFETAPSTDLAKKWQGWGTALKPANEPIVMARKPIEKGLTIASNVLKHGTGAINVDASRIGLDASVNLNARQKNFDAMGYGGNDNTDGVSTYNPQGRWPANILFDEDAAAVLDEMSGVLKTGGASRFFYVAKASKSERNAGLEGIVKEKQGARPGSKDSSGKFPDHDHRPSGGNNHPTVKPVKLMEYLVRMVTPPGGIVLDPFCGSGTTGVACKNLDFGFVGIEREAEYVEIARRRIA